MACRSAASSIISTKARSPRRSKPARRCESASPLPSWERVARPSFSAAPGEGGLALNGTANLTGAYYRLIRQANLTASSIGSAIGQIESPGSAGLGQADRQAGRRSDRAAPFERTLKMKKLMTVLVAALALGSSPSRPILPRQDTAMAVATDGM